MKCLVLDAEGADPQVRLVVAGQHGHGDLLLILAKRMLQLILNQLVLLDLGQKCPLRQELPVFVTFLSYGAQWLILAA